MKPRHGNPCFLLGFAAFVTVLLFASGCGGAIAGDWHMIKAIPNKEVFAIDNAHFAKDRTYDALVTIEGKTIQEKGKYKFDGLRLTMYPNAGGQRRYTTLIKGSTFQINSGLGKLILKKGMKSTDE